MFRVPHHKMRQMQAGQGLVEYGLILVLVAVAAIVALTLTGVEIRGEFCKILDAVTDDMPEFCDTSLEVAGTPVYEPVFQRVTLRATFDGGYDNTVSVTVQSTSAPTTTMVQNGNAYEANISLSSPCPCTFDLIASNGDRVSVRVE